MAPGDQPKTSGRRPIWGRPWLILLVAVALRLGALPVTWHAATYSDEDDYHRLAVNVAAGQGFCFRPGHPTAWRPPLWPAMMGLVYRVTGPDAGWIRLLQALLGVLLVALILRLASEVDDDPRVPVFAGWWAACSPTLLYHSHCLFAETLVGLCLTAAMLAMFRSLAAPPGRLGWAAAAGLALGLACLGRGSTLVFLPPTAVWLAYAAPGERRGGVRQAVVMLAACAVVVAPWTLRNHRVLGHLVPVETNNTINLFYGNNPQTPRLRPWDVFTLQPRPQPRLRPGASETELQRAALQEAVLYIRAHPVRFGTGLIIKTGNLWGLSRGLASGVGAGLYGPPSRTKRLLAAAWDGVDGLVLLALAILGVAWAGRRRPAELLILHGLTLTLIQAVCYGHSRYRFCVVSLLLAFAAAAAVHWPERRARWAGLPRWQRSLTTVLLVLLGLNWVYEVLVLELPRLHG